MSQQATPLRTDSVLANGAVAARTFVDFTGAQAATQGMKVLGVARAASLAGGDYIPVDSIGSAIVVAGAALAAGQSVITDNQGRAIPNTGALAIKAGATAVTSNAANGAGDLQGSDLPEFIVGDVAPGQSASAAGQFVEIIFRR